MADQDTDILKPGADAASGDDKDTDKNKTVTLTKEQQEHVNTIFNTRFAKITAKYEEQMKSLKEQLEAVKTTKDTANKGEGDDKDKGDDSPERKQFKSLLETERNKTKLAEAAAKQAQDEAKAARSESMRIRKEVAIARAATKQNFFELDVVTKMVWDNIEYDEEQNTFVIKENGAVKQNSSLVPMTLEEYFVEFASQRPYLVNGEVKGGANSTDNKNTSNVGIVKTRKDLKTAKEKSDFINKFGLEKFEALPPE